MCSRHGRGDVAQCVSLFFLFLPKGNESESVPVLGRHGSGDLLRDGMGEVAGWSLSPGTAAPGEFSVATSPPVLSCSKSPAYLCHGD